MFRNLACLKNKRDMRVKREAPIITKRLNNLIYKNDDKRLGNILKRLTKSKFIIRLIQDVINLFLTLLGLVPE